MTQLKDKTPQSPADRPSGGGYDDQNPLASLHKMSTTAGISSQEYVAINLPSIIALLVGLASVLAALSPVLLLVPVAGVAVGLVALSQIRASNGTQTGRAFAWLGIVLSLAVGSLVLAGAVVERSRTAADRGVIINQIAELGRTLDAEDYDKAYAMFSDRFRNRVNRAVFEGVWKQSQSIPELGRIVSMHWNETSIYFEDEPGSGTRVASAYAWVNFSKGKDRARHAIVFRKAGGTWVIDDAPQLFPGERRRPAPR